MAVVANEPAAQADTLVGCSAPSLVTAITNANASGGGALNLSSGCTYTLESGPYGDGAGNDGLPVVTSTITINGDGATVARDPSAPSFRLFEVGGTGSLSIDAVTLTRGSDASSYGGGAIENDNGGTVFLTGSTVSSNSATNDGGGLENHGNLVISNSIVSNNSASSCSGAIDNSGSLSITNSTLSDNQVGNCGGALGNGGVATITNSTLSGNNALQNSGAINSTGTVTITNSTLANNTTGGNGGGITNFGLITVTSSTFWNNSAGDAGGGIINAGTARLQSTLLAENSNGGCTLGFGVTDEGYNIDDDGSCGFGGTSISHSSSLDSTLGQLANNGGPTETVALLPGSPAIGYVPSGYCQPTDQRGAIRIAPCDIGAYDTSGLPQAIVFTSVPPSEPTVGSTYTVTAAGGGSGNEVTFTTDPSSALVCSINGATVSLIGPGTCTIDANQEGNGNYQASPQVQQSFTVVPPPTKCSFLNAEKERVSARTPISFLVEVACYPAPTLTATGLPSWLTLTDYHDGYGVLTSSTSVAGTYKITLGARNSVGAFRQRFTLVVK